MTSKASNQDIKIPNLSSHQDFEPSELPRLVLPLEIDTPSHHLASDSHPSTSNNRILADNFSFQESAARFNEETPQSCSRRRRISKTSFSISIRQGKTPRRLRTPGANGEFSGFTEAVLEYTSSSLGIKQEGSEGISMGTPTSASLMRRTPKKKHLKNRISPMQTLAAEEDDEEIDIFEDKKEIEKEKKKSKGKVIVEKLLKSVVTNIVVGIVTVFALFVNDVRALVNLEMVDLAFDVITIVTIAVFVMEIGFSLYVEEGYLWSMFFWLDIFSTFSMIFDVEFLIEDVIPHQAHHSRQVAEASRASRIATKQGRVIRIIRLAQLGKLYKQINTAKVQKEFEAQKEANLFKQQIVNLKRQSLFQNNQKSIARIYPEPSNQPHLTTQGHEIQHLITKTEERIDTDLGETGQVRRKSGKIAPCLQINRSQEENYLSVKLNDLRPEMSQQSIMKIEQEDVTINQQFSRNRVRKSTILVSNIPRKSLSAGIPKNKGSRTDQIGEQEEEKDQGEVASSQPFNRKRNYKSTVIGSKTLETSLTKLMSRTNKPKIEQEEDQAINQPLNQRKSFLLGRNSLGINPPKVLSGDQGVQESKTLDRSEPQKEEGVKELAPKELRIGRRLTELTTKRVVFMALALLIVIPLCNADFYFSGLESQEYEMELLGELIDDPGVASGTVDAAIANFVAELSSHHEPKLVYLAIGNNEYYQDENFNLGYYKSSDTSTVTIITKNKGAITSIMTLEYAEKIEAWLNIGKIIFMCVLLTIAAVFFSKDTDRMILRPLERIVVKINKLARDPLQAKQHDLVIGSHHEGFENETIKLENAIVKIGHLLAIGYGELGSRIITHNVSSVEDISSSALIGEKQAAIFGFCKINDFVEITEVLQEDVVIFVNSVADIVHSLVDVYQGSVSKNIGDAFFVVWKFPEEDVFDHMDGQIEILNSEQTVSLVDCALFSFLKIFAKIKRDPTLEEYKKNGSLGRKIPNFETSISLALHAGWAYEGAIGSEYKIDASYLSSDVQIVARLTAAAKKYKVPLVITGSVYLLLSEKVRKYARLIDTVVVKEATEPMDLYTIDVDLEGMEVSEDRRKIMKEEKKKYIKGVVSKGNASSFLTEDSEIEHMLLRKYDEKFVEMFDSAIDSYAEGEWKAAYAKLMKCLEMKGNDGPSVSLANFIEKKHNFVVPEDFQGYRDFKDI